MVALGLDGAETMAVSEDGQFIVTSPSMPFVPRLVQGVVSVTLKVDGYYGVVDPLLWPQIYSPRYPYLAAVRKKPLADHPHAPMWRDPSPTDFEEIPGIPVRGIGCFSSSFLEPFDLLVQRMNSRVNAYLLRVGPQPELSHDVVWHCMCMRLALSRLRFVPATFRDQVLQMRTLQRHWILADAFLEFYHRLATYLASNHPQPLQTTFTGTWTTDPGIAQQLQELGLPVWFVRQRQLLPDRVRTRSVLPFTEPVEICADCHSGASPIYEGLVGDRHLKAICSRHSLYMDVSHVPVSSSTISGLGRMQPPQPSLSSTERQVKGEPDESSILMDLKLPFHSMDCKKDVSCEKVAPWREVPAPGGPGATRLKPKASHYNPCKQMLTHI